MTASDTRLRTARSWRDAADARLAEIYAAAEKEGRKPTAKEIFDGYPFVRRQYEPYKVWLGQKKRWALGEPLRKRPSEKTIAPLVGQEALL